jgi:hypothetical protein
MTTEFNGSVIVNGRPNPTAEIFLLSSTGKPVAIASVNDNGKYTIGAPPGFGEGWLIAKLYAPIVGARARAVAAPETVDFSVGDAEAHLLVGEIVPPAGVEPDWIDVQLTPRALDGFPEVALGALLAVDTGNSIRGSFVSQRKRQLNFEFRALPGLYDLRVNRIIDVPLDTQLPIPNLTAKSVQLENGQQATERFGGFLVPLDRPRSLSVVLQTAPTY